VERDLVVKGPEILGNLWDKAGHCGRVEVMREVLYDMISALQGRCAQGGPKPNTKSQDIMHGCSESNLLPISGLASKFQVREEELEISSAGEQLYRLRRRAALAQFYDDYTRVQADPHAFLYPGTEWRALG
jgi:hypothetical protein